MTGLVLIFVVVFVLVLAAVCALLVLRMLPPFDTPERPPFPRRPIRPHHYAGANSRPQTPRTR
jgi:hypothetical protein